jgi:hypothetical protein
VGDGFRLLIDNTTLHRLSVALDVGREPLDRLEVANVLHLIECLVLAEELTVNSFESRGSQERSNRILDWLENTESRGLIGVSSLSNATNQMAIASSVAGEMYERGLIVPHEGEPGDVGEIDVKLGRPVDVVEVADAFWSELAGDLGDLSLVQARALDEVEKHRTDGLFVYGLAQHEELVSWLNHVYSRSEQPSAEHWSQLHVVFRTLFNQQLAERDQSQSYAPPPVRAAVLRTVYSQTISQLRASLSNVAFGFHIDLDNGAFAEELLQGASDPLPLLGLAYMLQADAVEGATAPFEHRLAAARELAAPMRGRLGRLELLAKSDPSKYLRELRAEADTLENVTRSRLGLSKGGGLDFSVDLGVSLDPSTGSPALRMGLGTSASSIRAHVRGRLARHRVSVLSDGLVQTARYGTIDQAVRQAVH